MKIVFFGTSKIGIEILQNLHTHHEVKLVVTAPDQKVGRKHVLTPSPIAQAAAELGLTVTKPLKAKKNPELLELLQEQLADIFIVVSYGKILPAELIYLPPLKTLNVHFSLLPKYRGAAPVQFALLNGETKTGTTIFILDEQMDTGPILAQEEIEILPHETNLELQHRLGHISAELLVKILPLYQQGQIKPQPQDHTQATYTKIIKKLDGLIDWHNSAEKIYNQYRAFSPWPGIYTTWQNKTLKILECRVSSPSTIAAEPGTVQDSLVHCGNASALQLITVQLEGKKPLPIEDFLNGYQLEGQRLG